MKQEILENIDSVVAGYVNRYASDWTEIDRPLVEKCDDSVPFMVMMRPSGVDVAFFDGENFTKENALHSQAALPYHDVFLYYDGAEMKSVRQSDARELCSKAVSCFLTRDVPMDGFKKAVERCAANFFANMDFKGAGIGGACGPWEVKLSSDSKDKIAVEILFDSKPVALGMRQDDGIAVEFSRVDECLSDRCFKEIFDAMHSEFPNYRLSAKEEERLNSASQNLGR